MKTIYADLKNMNTKFGLNNILGGDSKYKNKKTEYDGVLYDSKKEAEYAQSLDLRRMERGPKKVIDWKRQVKYPVSINGKHICNYLLDFEVTLQDNSKEYIDVKGYKKGQAYAIFKLKKAMVEAMYGIEIKEV